MRSCASLVTMRLSPATRAVKKSPGRSICSVRPTQIQWLPKIRSRSCAKTSGDVYQRAGKVFAPPETLGFKNVVIVWPRDFCRITGGFAAGTGEPLAAPKDIRQD